MTCDSIQQPQVRSQLDRLQSGLDKLEAFTETLMDRLDPVSLKLISSSSNEEKPPAPLMAPLASRINTEAQRVEALCARVEEAIKTLEI